MMPVLRRPMLVFSPERTKYCMSARAGAEGWTTHDRQEQKCDEIVDLFYERYSETTLMRDNKTSEETTKDWVYT
jgi:hypothetical protein